MDRETVERYLEVYRENFGASLVEAVRASSCFPLLCKAVGFSPFVGNLLSRRKDLLELFLDPRLLVPSSKRRLLSELKEGALRSKDPKGLAVFLRRAKQREVVKILTADLAGASFTKTARRISSLAEALLEAALEGLCRFFSLSADDVVVFGFGKLGGRELNYSSDIDLVYFHAKGADKFRVIRMFETLTRVFEGLFEGERLWKVDLRLRPGGKEGELSVSVPAALNYYLYEIHPFERLALIRARPVAGNLRIGYALYERLKPVIFPKYLDYSYVEHIRDLKERIKREAKRRGAEDDIKVGEGGIREVEFLVQGLQSIYGGKFPSVRKKGIVPSISALRRSRVLERREAEELKNIYAFLRTVEHRIQTRYFQQTARLPREPAARKLLAKSLSFESEEAFLEYLGEVRRRASEKFEDFLAPRCPPSGSELVRRISEALLTGEGLKDLSECARISSRALEELSKLVRKGGPLGEKRRAILSPLIPVVVDEALRSRDPEKALLRTVSYIERLGGRLALLSAFKQKPEELKRLIRLVTLSEFVWRMLELHPELAEVFFEPPMELSRTLVERRVLTLSYEEALSFLRTVKNETVIFTAIRDLEGRVPIYLVTKRLNEVAEVFTRLTFEVTVRRLREEGRSVDPEGTCVLALGKFGAKEPGYRSDLDLVFVYEGDLKKGVAFTKFAQRYISYLSLRLSGGEGYRVDVRLRPEGRKGPLAVPVSGLFHYYEKEAGLWELFAATRLRFLAGDEELGKKVVKEVKRLVKSRATDSDLNEMYEMRLQMERHRAKERNGFFNPKLGRGGLADLEFLAALNALRSSLEDPPVNTLELLSDSTETNHLVPHYLFLREVEQKLVLLYDPQEEDPVYPVEVLEELSPWLGSEVKERYRKVTEEVRRTFERVFRK